MTAKRIPLFAALAVLALPWASAQAGVRIGVGIGVPCYRYRPCYYPYRIYVGPPPVVVAPAPVIVAAPAPVAVAPVAPVVLVPPAAPVVAATPAPAAPATTAAYASPVQQAGGIVPASSLPPAPEPVATPQ